MADPVTKVQRGTQVTVGSWSTDILDGTFSGESSDYTPTAPAPGHENYPTAEAVLHCGDGFGTGAYVDSPVINLYARPKNIDGVGHAPVPSADWPAKKVGYFLVDKSGTAAQYLPVSNDVKLDAEQSYFLENKTGRTLTGQPTGITLKMQAKGIVGDTS